jgi:hypothetical protein
MTPTAIMNINADEDGPLKKRRNVGTHPRKQRRSQ